MKTIHRANMPDSIKANAKTYTLDIEATHSKTPPTDAICLMLTNNRLRGKRDLHGQPYKPSRWIFTPQTPATT